MPATGITKHSTKSSSAVTSKKQLGMLMLLLAAETMAGCSQIDQKVGMGSATTTSHHHQEVLSADLLCGGILPPSSKSDSAPSTTRTTSLAGDISETVSDDDGSLGEDTLSNTPSSVGDEDPAALMKLLKSEKTLGALRGAGSKSSTTTMSVHDDEDDYSSCDHDAESLDDDVVSTIMSFLSWKDVREPRQVNRRWYRQSLTTAAVLRMPVTGTPALFIPCAVDLESAARVDEAELAPAKDEWMCSVCGCMNGTNRVGCINRVCGGMYPSLVGTTRMFMGQLRREATTSMIRWLFNEVLNFPGAALVGVENHLHKKTFRGTGCAWVYASAEAALAIQSLHRRSFFDTVSGVEGLWVVQSDGIPALEKEIAGRNVAGGNNHHQRHMPRSALVAERPAKDLQGGSSSSSSTIGSPTSSVSSPFAKSPNANNKSTTMVSPTGLAKNFVYNSDGSQYRYNPYGNSIQQFHGNNSSAPSYHSTAYSSTASFAGAYDSYESGDAAYYDYYYYSAQPY